MTQEHFADRFIHSARRLRNPLCVGLDPYLERIPVEFGVKLEEPASDATADGVLLGAPVRTDVVVIDRAGTIVGRAG